MCSVPGAGYSFSSKAVVPTYDPTVRAVDPEEMLRPVDVGLSREELKFLIDGLAEWGGVASARTESASLAGYDSAATMDRGAKAIHRTLAAQDRLSRRDWQRAVVLTELMFGSDTFGAGVEWETVTGRDEMADLRLLREVQRKLVAVCPPER